MKPAKSGEAAKSRGAELGTAPWRRGPRVGAEHAGRRRNGTCSSRTDGEVHKRPPATLQNVV